MRKKAVVLLSGGLDSATTLYYARKKGYDCTCLIFDYGQRHRREIKSARNIARHCKVPFLLIRFRMPWKHSALLDMNIHVPQGRKPVARRGSIPVTYVPARNTVFLSFAVSCAESIGAEAVFIGANAVDFSGYPDCRPAYYQVFNKVVRRGTKAGIEGRKLSIHTPLIQMKKADIIRMGKKLGVPYRHTWSCYIGGKRPCGKCDSCLIRARGFEEAGIEDPLTRP